MADMKHKHGFQKLLHGIVVMIIFMCLTEVTKGNNCPTGSVKKMTHNQSCYVYHDKQMSWYDADEFCRNTSNGRLLSIESFAEQNRLRYWFNASADDILTGDGTGIWTAGYLNKTDVSPRWKWKYPQTAGSFDRPISSSILSDRWADDQPGDGECIATGTVDWFSQDCEALAHFVCEYSCIEFIVTNSSAVVSSPNYPSYYPADTYCEWHIEIAGEERAQLVLTSFFTQSFYDTLSVYSNNGLIRSLSGSEDTPQTIDSPSRFLYLVFSSNDRTQYSGFTGHVSKYVRRVTGQHGVVTSDNFPANYSSNLTSSWYVETLRGAIRLKFTEVNIQASSKGNCSNDRLIIQEGGPEGSVLLTLCGNEVPDILNSQTKTLYFTFISNDDSRTGKGFRTVFWSTTESCVYILGPGSGTITSPNYPNDYGYYENCAWYIDVGSGNAQLTFSYFSVQYDSICYDDKVTVYDAITANATRLSPFYGFCGSSTPTEHISSASRYLSVYFKTDGSFSYKGFEAYYYTPDNCSFTVTGDSGNFSSVGYPRMNYPNNITCTWLVDVKTSNVTLNFRTLLLAGSDGKCSNNDRIEIYDGKSDSSPLIGTFCDKKDVPEEVKASSNYLLVKMVTDASGSHSGFMADFYRSDLECLTWGFDVSSFKWNNTCYGIIRSYSYWSTGRSYCEYRGTSLVAFETEQELNAVSGWLQSEYSYAVWTAGYRRVTNSSAWYWSLKTGDELMKDGPVNTLWQVGEPDLGDKYMFLLDSKLGALDLESNSYYFVCEEPQPQEDISISPAPLPPVMCSPPPNIRSGYYTPPLLSYKNSSVVTYQCDFGREMIGWPKLTCVDGLWNTHTPICRDAGSSGGSYCSPPPNVQFATFSPIRSSYPDNTVVIFSCYSGYKLLGDNNSITCSNGFWNGFAPYCAKE